jgi:hypothetical protein
LIGNSQRGRDRAVGYLNCVLTASVDCEGGNDGDDCADRKRTVSVMSAKDVFRSLYRRWVPAGRNKKLCAKAQQPIKPSRIRYRALGLAEHTQPFFFGAENEEIECAQFGDPGALFIGFDTCL